MIDHFVLEAYSRMFCVYAMAIATTLNIPSGIRIYANKLVIMRRLALIEIAMY